MIDILLCLVSFASLFGGLYFFSLSVHDIFCPIGKEYLFRYEDYQKEKQNLKWNRKK